MRIFYAAGPGNVIRAHKHWMRNEHDPNEMSLTYSSQFAEFCRDVGAEAYIVSYHPERERFRDACFLLEHRPKAIRAVRGIGYHVREILYGLQLVAAAIRFRADVAVISSGSTHYFAASLFRLAGIPPLIVLHNTLWPSGFPPNRLIQRLISRLDSWFFRWASAGTLGVSPECINQVKQLTGGRSRHLHQFRPQFNPQYFKTIPPPPPHDQRPFRVMYAGSISRSKGLFDILEMARKVEDAAPQQVQWDICGSGIDLVELRRRHAALGLERIVNIRGWTSPRDMRDVFLESHICIVPTKSDFTEGMAKTVVEAILAGRPVITNPVVPALEIVRAACIEARTNDIDSYVGAILKLITDPGRYYFLCSACRSLQYPFYDEGQGLRTVLRQAFNGMGLPPGISA
jgi:glycogen synthase